MSDDWIDVRERLPEDTRNVEIKWDIEHPKTCEGFYHRRHGLWYRDVKHGFCSVDVTHWRELPELPGDA